ncbi:ATP-binding protein [Paenibacillus chondroitinus]|uniref:ATP-binding protein n=2 Tax=Paenibacillus chondroitinus TaxID=59842 RepID=A0ABU6DBM4_9BACL|nr:MULTISPECIES: ATP-binding protein [Paenibacillus]MCY9661551.1 ATP-binding protein [Paenibacillus anseongense]MEB4795164.1 ATP-binding protein [Paenibacillus chondroitinus]
MLMSKPFVIIINGLPGTGKTTLAKRLEQDLRMPLFSRDGIYETLYDALDCQNNSCPPLMAPASFTMLYAIAGTLLSAGQSMIIEGFFGRPELRSAEFLKLQQRTSGFEPIQILCRTDGKVLLERFLTRMGAKDRHAAHADLEWIEQEENKERILRGDLTPLTLGGTMIEVDTTTPDSFDYALLIKSIKMALLNSQDN